MNCSKGTLGNLLYLIFLPLTQPRSEGQFPTSKKAAMLDVNSLLLSHGDEVAVDFFDFLVVVSYQRLSFYEKIQEEFEKMKTIGNC